MDAWDGQGRAITGVSISLGTLATCIVCTRMGAVYKRKGFGYGLEDAMVALSNVRGLVRPWDPEFFLTFSSAA